MKSEQNTQIDCPVESLNLISLPPEILLHIFNFLASPNDLVALTKSNKTLRNIAFDQRLWQPYQNLRFQKPKTTLLSGPLTSDVQIILPSGYMISGNEEGDFDCRVWDLATGNCMVKLSGHKDKITTLASTEDCYVVSGDCTGLIRIWDTGH